MTRVVGILLLPPDGLTPQTYRTESLSFLSTIPPRQNGTNGHSTGATLALRVIIVGASVGGLAAGIALAKAGLEVVILEAAPALGEVQTSSPGHFKCATPKVGDGIQLTPNVTR